jgi:hypothetical protein
MLYLKRFHPKPCKHAYNLIYSKKLKSREKEREIERNKIQSDRLKPTAKQHLTF